MSLYGPVTLRWHRGRAQLADASTSSPALTVNSARLRPIPRTPLPVGTALPHMQAGKVVKLGSGAAAVDAYVAVPAGGKPEAAVVMFSDIFG